MVVAGGPRGELVIVVRTARLTRLALAVDRQHLRRLATEVVNQSVASTGSPESGVADCHHVAIDRLCRLVQ